MALYVVMYSPFITDRPAWLGTQNIEVAVIEAVTADAAIVQAESTHAGEIMAVRLDALHWHQQEHCTLPECHHAVCAAARATVEAA